MQQIQPMAGLHRRTLHFPTVRRLVTWTRPRSRPQSVTTGTVPWKPGPSTCIAVSVARRYRYLPPLPLPVPTPCTERAVVGGQHGEPATISLPSGLHSSQDGSDIVADRWQVDLGSVQEIRAVQLVNRADCCEDRLVGARIVVSSTPDYEERGSGGGDPVSCGSVDEAESPIGEQDVIIKVCELGTAGRYVTVVGPNRLYPDVDNLFLSLCEVAVYGECPPLSEEAMGGTLSAAAAAAAESLGANCDITMGTEGPLSFADAERSCNAAGGHLASIHNEQEADYARALIANSPYVACGEAWIGLNDLHVECRKIAILSRFVALSSR